MRAWRATHIPFLALLVAVSMLLPACSTFPAGSLVVGEQVAIEGDVVRVDTAPWTYDGNAVVTVATTAHGNVDVHLPARWNLCKAPPPDDVQALLPRDRVQAVGMAGESGEIVVCAAPEHRLHKIE